MKNFEEMSARIINKYMAMHEASAMLRETIFSIVLANTARHKNIDNYLFTEIEEAFKTFESCEQIIVLKDENEIESYDFIDSHRIYDSVLKFTSFVVSHDVWYENEDMFKNNYFGFLFHSNGHEYRIVCK